MVSSKFVNRLIWLKIENIVEHEGLMFFKLLHVQKMGF